MLMARHPAAPKVLTLTDADPDTLYNLTRNLGVNGVAVGEAPASSSSAAAAAAADTRVSVLRLDWRDFDSAALRDLAADLVVGADILYDPLEIPYLLNTLAGSSTYFSSFILISPHFYSFVCPPLSRRNRGKLRALYGQTLVVYQYTMYVWWCIRSDIGCVPVHYVHVVLHAVRHW